MGGDRSRFKNSGRPPPKQLNKKVEKILKKIEKQLAEKEKNIRRNQKASDETLRENLIQAMRSGSNNKEAIEAIVMKFLDQDCGVKDNPQLQQEVQNLRDEQKKLILDSMLDLVEAMES